jgi:hypothetical protein
MMITIVLTGDNIKYEVGNILMVSHVIDMAAREG